MFRIDSNFIVRFIRYKIWEQRIEYHWFNKSWKWNWWTKIFYND